MPPRQLELNGLMLTAVEHAHLAFVARGRITASFDPVEGCLILGHHDEEAKSFEHGAEASLTDGFDWMRSQELRRIPRLQPRNGVYRCPAHLEIVGAAPQRVVQLVHVAHNGDGSGLDHHHAASPAASWRL